MEIKFRGKPVHKGGIWVEGIGAYKTQTAEHIIVNAKGDSIEVVHLTQYTGLNDINGTKIFEGDIIEGLKYKHFIKYNNVQASYVEINVDYPEDSGCHIDEQWIKECDKVVIGNIYDNKELIKQL